MLNNIEFQCLGYNLNWNDEKENGGAALQRF
jgi:hypothetical protein